VTIIINKKNYHLFLLVLFLTASCSTLFAQKTESIQLKYVSPLPGSKFIMPENNIALRNEQVFDNNCLSLDLLSVIDESGNNINGSLRLSTDNKTLIFLPDKPYPLGQNIHVSLKKGLKTIRGWEIEPLDFMFTITPELVNPPAKYLLNQIGSPNRDHAVRSFSDKIGAKDLDLPPGFPPITITTYEGIPHDEYYFISTWVWAGNYDPYLIIFDAIGVPVFYQKADLTYRDFKLQHNGYLSYAAIEEQFYKLKVLDSSYQCIDTFQIGNGYTLTDMHDFHLFENGHAFVIAQDWQNYAMDTVVPGGDPNAMLCGFIIQEQDADKNVIFQWRSWDHFHVTDAGPQIDLTASFIDYVHGNAIEIESDTSILLSSRSLDEITKIHRNTGEIIWRFGGKKNQFLFLNDTLGFTMQHDCRRLLNGHVTLFDNGTMHPDPKFSSALEYSLNEDSLEAYLVNRFRNNPDIFGGAMGNAQWTFDSSIVVGWGNGNTGITEFKANGEVSRIIDYPAFSYRAFRFPWETNYFLSGADTLNFECFSNDSTIQTVNLYNPNDFEIEITSSFNHTDFFTVENDLSIIIPANESMALLVKFKSDTIGTFLDCLTLNSDINTDTLVRRIARQVALCGVVVDDQNANNYLESGFTLMPNPASEYLNIRFADHISGKLLIYDLKGQKLAEELFSQVAEVKINVQSYPVGLYFIEIDRTDRKSKNRVKFIKK